MVLSCHLKMAAQPTFEQLRYQLKNLGMIKSSIIVLYVVSYNTQKPLKLTKLKFIFHMRIRIVMLFNVKRIQLYRNDRRTKRHGSASSYVCYQQVITVVTGM
jgi:hypothetical protein